MIAPQSPRQSNDKLINLFIAYDLMQPGQNRDAVRDAIKSSRQWRQFQFSLFHVNTEFPPASDYAIVDQHIDASDRLAVINSDSGVISNWKNRASTR